MQTHAATLQRVSHLEPSDDPPPPIFLTREALIVEMSCCNRLLLFTPTVLTAQLTNASAAELLKERKSNPLLNFQHSSTLCA